MARNSSPSFCPEEVALAVPKYLDAYKPLKKMALTTIDEPENAAFGVRYRTMLSESEQVEGQKIWLAVLWNNGIAFWPLQR